MESFASLAADHAEIGRRTARIRDEAQRGSDGAAAAQQAIAALSDLLREHLKVEDRVIYRRLLTCRDDAIVETARAARRSFATLAHDWQWYAAHWTAEAIGEDPLAFIADTDILLDRLDARIVFEDEKLYPLAAGLAEPPSPDRPAAS